MPPAPSAPPAAPAKPPTPPAAPPAAGAPAAPPAAAPVKAPVLPKEPDPADWMGDIGADLDALSEAEDAKAEGRKPGEKRVDKPAKGKEAPPGKQDDTPPAAPGTPPEPPEPTKINDLRSAYSTLKKRVKDELEPKIQSLEAKVKETATANPAEIKALQTRLEAAERRRDELETRISELDFQSSKAFEDKYRKPYVQAWNDAMADLKELSVELENGTTRAATQEDLLKLANLPLGEARKLAKQLFGDSADDMMAHRRKIIDLSNAQAAALENARTEAVERAKTMESDRRTNGEKMQGLWKEANSQISAKWPKMFAPVEGDQEGNDLLTKGTAMADRLFAPTEETAPKSPEEAVRLHALMRNKIANHDRLALWLKKARERIKELETNLAEYEGSNPNGGLDGGGAPDGGASRGFLEDVERELDELDKKGV